MVCYIPRKRPSGNKKPLSFSLLLTVPAALMLGFSSPSVAADGAGELELAYYMPADASSVESENYKKKKVQISQGLQPLSHYLQEKSAKNPSLAEESPYFTRKMQRERQKGKAVLRHAAVNPLPPVPNFSAAQGTSFTQEDFFEEAEAPTMVENITVKAGKTAVVIEDLTDPNEPPSITVHKDAVVHNAPLMPGQAPIASQPLMALSQDTPLDQPPPNMESAEPFSQTVSVVEVADVEEANLAEGAATPPQAFAPNDTTESAAPEEAVAPAIVAAAPEKEILPWLKQAKAEDMGRISPASGGQMQPVPSIAQQSDDAPSNLRFLSAMPDDPAEEGVQEMGLAVPPELLEREPLNPMENLKAPTQPVEAIVENAAATEAMQAPAVNKPEMQGGDAENLPKNAGMSLAEFLELEETPSPAMAPKVAEKKAPAIILGEISPDLMEPEALLELPTEENAPAADTVVEKAQSETLPWSSKQAMPLIQQMPEESTAKEVAEAEDVAQATKQTVEKKAKEKTTIAMAAIAEKELPEIAPAAKAKDDLLVVKSKPIIIEKKITPSTTKVDPVISKLLNEVPAGALEDKPQFMQEEVAVARVDVPSLEANAEDIGQHEQTGIHIQVKKAGVKVDEYLRKARSDLNAGEYQRAIAYYEAVLDSHKNHKHALFGLATTYHRAGQLDSAKRHYQKLLEQDGTHKPALHNLMVLISQQSDEESLPYLHELQAKNPSVAAIPAHIALIYAKQIRYNEAIEKLQEAIRLDSDNASYHYHMAVILDNAGYQAQAIRSYQRVEQLYQNGVKIPVTIVDIQQRLTFLLSNIAA